MRIVNNQGITIELKNVKAVGEAFEKAIKSKRITSRTKSVKICSFTWEIVERSNKTITLCKAEW